MSMGRKYLDSLIADILIEQGVAPTDFFWEGEVVRLLLPWGGVQLRLSRVAFKDLEGVRKRLLKEIEQSCENTR